MPPSVHEASMPLLPWCPLSRARSRSLDLDQLPKWSPVTRRRLTADQYRYVFDDGASMLCFDTLSETAEPIASSPVAGEKPPPEDRNG
ncbi:hypothetical protein ZWY2020_050450 [Hordeum vulgare]|nr:hypothetical protein ZWY2020_050450 [Hordeum vulgare]